MTFSDGRYRSHPAAASILPGIGIEAIVDCDTLGVIFECRDEG